MIKGKKLTVIALSLMLTTGFASGAMANNGKGAGLADAPGQSENFSKGVTTVVDVTENITYETKEETDSAITSTTATPGTSTVVGEPVVVSVNTYKEYHQQQDRYRIITETTSSTTTTVSNWEDTTTVTTHYFYETPVTITETTTTTSTHRGAPGSNGKQLSQESVTNVTSVDGERVLVDSHEYSAVTKGEVSESKTTTTNTEATKGDWVR